ncbi:MAG: putative transrane anti-sigma factor [Clostridiales bacterium]|nr:putative transrane anti-sigma factor [Clostridiales bacterium]
MNCFEIQEKLIDYIDDRLDNNEKEYIKLHIESCDACKAEYEGILETIGYMQQSFDKIVAPKGFMEEVKESIKKPVNQRIIVKKPIKTIIIAAAITLLFTITAFAAGGFDFLKWFQAKSLQESKSMEELIASGYGENVNLSAQDKNIKFTIENVVADDTCTILSYSIEDLNKEKKYVLSNYMKEDLIEGEFAYPFENTTDPYIIDSILYSDVPYIQRGLIRLEPTKEENSTISITINQLQYGDKMPLSNVKGIWKLNIPITKHKVKTYVLNKEVDIDGNKVIFKEIKIAPTNTALTYFYVENQKGYSIRSFENIKLIANGKEYKRKYMGVEYLNGTNGNQGITIEFDSMYLDEPDNINIFIGGYSVNVYKSAYYDIDINKPFPQVFEYFGSKISIDDIKVGDEKTEVTMSQTFGKNKYEEINAKFKVKGHPFAHGIYSGLEFESIIIDKKGRKVDPKDMDEAKTKKLQPRTYYIKQQLILEDSSYIENLPEEYHTGKFIPVQLSIQGYKETRYVNESFTIKLEE